MDGDLELVAAIAAGSADALARLYDRHAGIVFGMARRVLSRLEDAEEVVQDVFAQIWREASRYERTRASVAGWVAMLARARAIDRRRARQARPDLHAPVAADAAPTVRAWDPSPEQVTISAEDARDIRAAVVALPDAQRSLVELAFYDGLTHAEIAERTGVPLGTVKTRIRTAMVALRAVLKP
jgi:RNA polymerase sigma-70 factor (ECF subfamily)